MSDTTPAEVPAVEAPTEEVSDTQKKRAAYAAAEQRLREENSDRFKALVNEEAAARGVTYTFRKTEAERAEQTLNDLLAAHPELRERINPQTPQPLPPA